MKLYLSCSKDGFIFTHSSLEDAKEEDKNSIELELTGEQEKLIVDSIKNSTNVVGDGSAGPYYPYDKINWVDLVK